MPTAAATKNQPFEPRFKIAPAASPMPENHQPERLAPGRHQIGMVGEIIFRILGEIKSVHPGDIIAIRKSRRSAPAASVSSARRAAEEMAGPSPSRS
jgi:hypothetical protein